jgi:hypothetical protein
MARKQTQHAGAARNGAASWAGRVCFGSAAVLTLTVAACLAQDETSTKSKADDAGTKTKSASSAGAAKGEKASKGEGRT